MGLRFFKRVNLGNGTGVNVSGSGFSVSQRGKYGSFGTKGFSVRTGIPGVSFRQSWGSSGGSGLQALLILIIGFLLIYTLYNLIVFLLLILYNIFGFITDGVMYLIRVIRIMLLKRKLRRDQYLRHDSTTFKFVAIKERDVDGSDVFLEKILEKNGRYVRSGKPVCMVISQGVSTPISLGHSGVITWYKIPGQVLNDGDDLLGIDT